MRSCRAPIGALLVVLLVIPLADIVIEFLAGTRVNKDGQRASASQIQGGWTLKF